MPDEVFHATIRNLKGIKYTGAVTYQFYGEPLLDSRLVDFVKYTRENLPSAMFVKVISNGDYLTEDLFERLIEAGMAEISITIHDRNPARRMERLQPLIDKHPSNIRVTSIHGHKSLSNRGGAVEIEGETAKKRCMFPRNAIVDFEGNVLLCCNDYFHANRFGNVVDESILTIWKKKDFRALRKAAKKGKPELQLCEDCLYPGQQSSHDES